MASRLEEANKLGNLFNTWSKVLGLIGGAIVSCTVAYWMIIENTKDIGLETKARIEAIDLLEQRSNNRYDRAMKIADKLELLGIDLEKRVRELEKENAYLKGRYELTHK